MRFGNLERFIKKTHFRLFAFWDKSNKEDTVVISTHGLVKKQTKLQAEN